MVNGKKLFLFLHIFKTGGSTFRRILKDNFGDEAAIENPYMCLQNYTKEQIEQLFYLYSYRIFAGHVFRLRDSLKALNSSIQLIAFTRDPVEKAMSIYYYLRNRDTTNPNHPVKSKSFIEMVDFVLNKKSFNPYSLDASQLEWLVGSEDASTEEVREAVRLKRLLLFPTEEFDLACVILERMFPDDFKDCSYSDRANVSSRPKLINTNERAAAERLPWIGKDRRLHEFSKQNIKELSISIFKSELEIQKALQDFRLRCKKRKNGTKTHLSKYKKLKTLIKNVIKKVF
jgi:hypothetical protein